MEGFVEKQRELEARENALREREAALALEERQLKRKKGMVEVQIEDLVQVKRERRSVMEALKKEDWEQKASQCADLRAAMAAIGQLLQEVGEGLECCLCMKRNACTAFVPCGHTFCGSADCGSSFVDECPTCRAKVMGRTKLFGVEGQCEGIIAAMAAVEKVAAAAAVRAHECEVGVGAAAGVGRCEEVYVERSGGSGSRKRKAEEMEVVVVRAAGEPSLQVMEGGSLHGGQEEVVQSVGVSVVEADSAVGELSVQVMKGGSLRGRALSPEEREQREAIMAKYNSGGLEALNDRERAVLLIERRRQGMQRKRAREKEVVAAQQVASCSRDKPVRIWDVSSGKEAMGPLKGHDCAVLSVAFSPNGKSVASSSGHFSYAYGGTNCVKIWNLDDMTEVCTLKGHSHRVACVAWSPDGKQVASCSDKTVRIWDVLSGKEAMGPLKGHSDLVLSVAWSPCGKFVASGSHDGTIKIWDALTGAEKCSLKGHSKDNPECTCKQGKFRCDYKANPECPVTGHSDWVRSVAWSPDGKLVASGSDDKSIRIWDVATGKKAMGPLKGHSEAVSCVAWSPDGKLLASSSFDETIRIWDVSTGKKVMSGNPESSVKCLAAMQSYFMRENCNPFVGDEGGWMELDDDGLISKGHLKQLLLDPDLNLGQEDIEALDVESLFAYLLTLDESQGESVRKDVFNKALEEADTSAITYNPNPRLKCTFTLKGRGLGGFPWEVCSVAWSPDCRLVASSTCDSTIMIWDVATGKEAMGPLMGHSENNPECTCTHQPWGITVNRECPVKGHWGRVHSVTWSPDGKLVASGSDDKTVRIWDLVGK